MPEIIQIKQIGRYCDDLLVDYFGIRKTCILVTQKYYKATFKANIMTYVKRCSIYQILKAVKYKLYREQQFLLVFISFQKTYLEILSQIYEFQFIKKATVLT